MDIITSRSIHRRTSADALRICSELNVIPIMVSSPAKFLVAPFRDANIDRDQSTWVHGAAGCRFGHCAAASVGLARDPSVAGFLIFVFHRRPGDARVLVYSFASVTSGTPRSWAAKQEAAGVMPTNSMYKYTTWIKGVFAGLKGA
jgi:hypothetical protein